MAAGGRQSGVHRAVIFLSWTQLQRRSLLRLYDDIRVNGITSFTTSLFGPKFKFSLVGLLLKTATGTPEYKVAVVGTLGYYSKYDYNSKSSSSPALCHVPSDHLSSPYDRSIFHT